MKKNFLLVALLAGSLGANSFAATEIYVKASTGSDSYNGASWETAFKTVSKAVGSIKENEETIIYLEANTVFDTGGQLDLGNNKIVSIIGDNTTLRAAEKAGKDGGEGARILRIAGGCDVNVKGITFLNGRQIEYNPGGGLFFAGNTLVVDSCTFIDNTSDLANQAAIDISDNSEIPVKIINNTFYGNDGALRVGDIYGEKGGEVIFINNLVFANASGIFGAEGYSVADLRSPIIGYNNIIVGAERGVNEYIDDECFNDKKD